VIIPTKSGAQIVIGEMPWIPGCYLSVGNVRSSQGAVLDPEGTRPGDRGARPRPRRDPRAHEIQTAEKASSIMPTFRKKPVEVEAVQFTEANRTELEANSSPATVDQWDGSYRRL
jgi:hypothetical protein